MDKRSVFKSPLFYSTIFAVIVSVLGYYFISYAPTHKNDIKINESEKIVIKTSTELDTDKDGLPDWKETVYGSDSNNRDSDGDGVLDGAEINTGHDPMKKGPNDILLNLTINNSSTSTEVDLEKTFVSEFMSKEIDSFGSETINTMVKSFDSSAIKPRYSVSNLNVGYDNSEAKLKEYANNLGIIVNKYAKSGIDDESTILANAIKSKKETDLQKIEIPALAYKNFAEELRKIEVPNKISEHHLKIVSGYDVMSRSLYETEKLFNNPIAGSAGWQMYLSQIVTVTRGYAGVINVLHDNDVTFTKDEAGYQFRWKDQTDITQNSTSTKK